MIHYEKLVAIAPGLRFNDQLLRTHAAEIQEPPKFRIWSWTHMPEVELHLQSQTTEVEHAFWNMFVLSRYVTEGHRVFRVELGLARLLLDTTMPVVNGENFHLPFPSIFVEFPGRMFTIPHLDMPLIGCYMTDARPWFNQISLDFVFEPMKKQPGIREFGFHINLNVPPGEPVNWGNLYESFLQTNGPRVYPDKELLRKATLVVTEVIPLLVNAVLYSTSESPDIIDGITKWRRLENEKHEAKTSKQRERIRREQSSVPNTDQKLLGTSIVVQYGAPKASDNSEEARTARKILKRLRVRGHWRWFWYGAGRSLRKHRFVAPYWRGPADLAELLKRRYHLR